MDYVGKLNKGLDNIVRTYKDILNSMDTFFSTHISPKYGLVGVVYDIETVDGENSKLANLLFMGKVKGGRRSRRMEKEQKHPHKNKYASQIGKLKVKEPREESKQELVEEIVEKVEELKPPKRGDYETFLEYYVAREDYRRDKLWEEEDLD